MSFARSVLQSKQIAARVVARSSPATSTTATTSRTQTSKFWTTAPVEQEETQIKEAVKMTTQKEIVKAIAETHDLSLAESKRILSTVFDTIVDVSIFTDPFRVRRSMMLFLHLSYSILACRASLRSALTHSICVFDQLTFLHWYSLWLTRNPSDWQTLEPLKLTLPRHTRDVTHERATPSQCLRKNAVAFVRTNRSRRIYPLLRNEVSLLCCVFSSLVA